MSTSVPAAEAPDAVLGTILASGASIAIGSRLAGGFYAGRVNVDGVAYGLIVSPAAGALKGAWLDQRTAVPGAQHYADGLANTQAMAAAGSALAAAALALTIEGFADWYIPSRDELELVYRHFKPTDEENYADGLDGVNASSTPAGAAYTEAAPGQTGVETFKAGGADAMDDYWYWSSTQYAPDPSDAWGQDFDSGYQYNVVTSYAGRARAVRRLIIQ